jgi:hypothetical protein
MWAFLTNLAIVCASRCHIQTSRCHIQISHYYFQCASDLNISRNETLSHKKYWKPYPDLDPALAEEAQKAITRLLPSHLIYPIAGEIFNAYEQAFDRLQNYAMFRGFYIVVRSKDRNDKPYVERIRWRYIHYTIDIANNRGLKEHVFYDSEDKISIERKRENTKIMSKKCN